MSCRIETQWGAFGARFSTRGLCQLTPPGWAAGGVSDEAAPDVAGVTELAVQLRRYLAGLRVDFTVPVDLSGATPFQQRVWQTLRRLPYGGTTTYGELAVFIGRPRAARAVGQACGANPVPLVVPCHRVLAAGGRLGGWSGVPGWKERLLALERGAATTSTGDQLGF